MQELKNCPFCGSAKVESYQPQHDSYHFVLCRSCEAEGPAEKDEVDAIATWNRRATPPSPSTGIKPDPEHLIALALSGSLPEQQAGKVLRDAFAPSTASEVGEDADPFTGIQKFGMAKLKAGHPNHYMGEFIRLSDARAALAAKTAENVEHIEAAPPPDRRQGERRS